MSRRAGRADAVWATVDARVTVRLTYSEMSTGIAVGADTSLEPLEAALERVFGYQRFRRLQRPLVEATLTGRDILAVLPTGAGKSVCFQLPALLSTGVTLVVSPLISLMQDQVDVLRRRGVPAAALNSATPPDRRLAALRDLADGSLRLLYVSPERLVTASFRVLWRTPPTRLVVDEAHCISEWGHDFRPSYRHIAGFASFVGNPPIAAYTATATPATRADIETCLSLRRPFRAIASVDRPNVRWEVWRPRSAAEALERACDAVRCTLRSDPRGSAIVYVPTRARAALVAETLRRLGVRAGYYHAGLAGDVRRRVQRRFLDGDLRVVCATSAFGMGIDHPRIRLVCHFGMPGALESYVQEAGRAGRDGRASRALLLSVPGDRQIQATLIRAQWPRTGSVLRAWHDLSRPSSRRTRQPSESALRILREHGCVAPAEAGTLVRIRGPRPRDLVGTVRAGRRRSRTRLAAMCGYVATRRCRREYVARYFGERAPGCSGCDRCSGAGQP